jgi:transposase-like protein
MPLPGGGHQLRGAMVFRFQLSLRGIEELLFERGVIVTYRDGRRRFVRYAPKEVP